MQYIKGTNILFEYEGAAEAVLHNVSFEINTGYKVGLIGKNGSGKTTLFYLILGEIFQVSGFLHVNPNLKIGYLPQELRLPDDSLVESYLWSARKDLWRLKSRIDSTTDFDSSENLNLISDFEDKGGYNFEVLFNKVLAGFELNETFLYRKLSTLSGGEKTKIALCKVILKEPEVLLLDEPTNHLDVETLTWLENYLKEINLPFVVISHDRKFLDNCVSTIWEIENHRIKTYSGNYSFYKYEKELEYEQMKLAYEIQQKKIKQLERAIDLRKQKAVKRENFKHIRKKKKNGSYCSKDIGGGCYPTIRAEQSLMKSAITVMSRIERMIENEKADKPVLEKKPNVRLNNSSLRNNFILSLDKLGKTFSGKVIFYDLNLVIRNKSRIAIGGKNGSGKTTLLKIITGKLNSHDGAYKWAKNVKIGYFSQEHEDLNLNNSILEEVLQDNYEKQTKVRTLLGCLNIRQDKVYQKISSLSLGERSKVALAKVLLSNANVLVLDEPTNHLEISAREAIEDALLSFNGTIIFVSHDRYLKEKLATETFDMDNMKHIE